MKSRLETFVVLGTLALAALEGWRLSVRGVAITVTNATGAEIRDVHVRFTGGAKSTPAVEPTRMFATKANPTSESDLIVEYVDQEGTRHTHTIDVYLEPNYGGEIAITIQTNGGVMWNDKSKAWAVW